MTTKTKSTVAVAVFVSVAVAFFLIILCLTVLLPSDGEQAAADYGMRYNSMNVTVEWNKDRSCAITHELQAEFLDNGSDGRGSHGLYIDIPVNSGEKIRGIDVYSSSKYGDLPYGLEHENGFNIVRIKLGDDDLRFYRNDVIDCKITYEYITPVHPDGANLLDINAIGTGFTSPVYNAVVTVKYPIKPKANGSAYSVVATVGDGISDMSVSDDGLTYTVRAEQLAPFTGIRVRAEMENGVLDDYRSNEPILVIVLGILLVAAIAVMMLLLGKEKPLTPVVDFYPPRIDGINGEKRHMLPVQMGMLIDGSCSDSDVTSLIFYWANEGCLEIDQDGDDTYFVKLKDINPVTQYERQMFDKLFEKATTDDQGRKKASLAALKGNFAGAISAVKTGVKAEYRGKMYKTSNNVLCALSVLLCALFGVGFAVFTTFRIGVGLFNLLGVVVVIPVLFAAGFGIVLARNYMKFTALRRKVLLALLFIGTVLLSVAVMLVITTDAMSWMEKFVFAACLGIASAISPFITARKPEYTENLNGIIGFRDFLRDAEKDRLETLLESDPQYFYNILPYANVLGVSDIWADKFAGLAVEPPTYYRSSINVFDIMILHSLTRSIGSTLSYTPPKVNGGSFSGRSGGGHGGGFGGFGGGGGGRW